MAVVMIFEVYKMGTVMVNYIKKTPRNQDENGGNMQLNNYKERCNPLPLLSLSVKRQARLIGEGKYRIGINEPAIKMSLVIRCDGSRVDTTKQ